MEINIQERSFKLNQYEVNIQLISEKQVTIKVIDQKLRMEFEQSKIILENITTSTLILALQETRKDVSVKFNYIKECEQEHLQLKILVRLQFLKTIEESIFIKKIRNIDETQILQNKMKRLSLNLKQVKEKINNADDNTFSIGLKEESFTKSNEDYEVLQLIQLKKGKYLLTFSFLARGTAEWIYLYINTGKVLIANEGFYVPTGEYFIPYTLRTVYDVLEDVKDVSITTHYSSSYPVILRNRIITALKL